MRFREHAAISALIYVPLSAYLVLGGWLDPLDLLPILFLAFIGSIAPDFDLRESRARRLISKLILLILLILYLSSESISLPGFLEFLLLILVIYLILRLAPMRHRGFLHSLSAALIYSLISLALLSSLGIHWIGILPVFLGYFSHLLADRCLKLI